MTIAGICPESPLYRRVTITAAARRQRQRRRQQEEQAPTTPAAAATAAAAITGARSSATIPPTPARPLSCFVLLLLCSVFCASATGLGCRDPGHLSIRILLLRHYSYKHPKDGRQPCSFDCTGYSGQHFGGPSRQPRLEHQSLLGLACDHSQPARVFHIIVCGRQCRARELAFANVEALCFATLVRSCAIGRLPIDEPQRCASQQLRSRAALPVHLNLRS